MGSLYPSYQKLQRWNCDRATVALNCARLGLPGPREGLCLAMPMWERAGNKTYDYSGNNNNGTLVNNPSWIGTQRGCGVDCGVIRDDRYINVPHSESINIKGNGVSVELLLIHSIGENYSRIATKEKADGTVPYMAYGLLQYSTTSRIDMIVGNAAMDGYIRWETTSASLQTGVVTHLLGACDATIPSIDIYFNGILQTTSITQPGSAGTIGEVFEPFALGFDPGDSARHYPGTFILCRLWDVALSASQVQTLCNNPFGMFEPIRSPAIWSVPAVGDAVPTGAFYGPLYGPLGGPI